MVGTVAARDVLAAIEAARADDPADQPAVTRTGPESWTKAGATG